jgi:CRP/FNR family transcriptional regulator, cyclic AMP receptor protein
MGTIFEQTRDEGETSSPGADSLRDQSEISGAGDLRLASMRVNSGPKWNDARAPWRAGEFFKSLPPEGMSEFESLAAPFSCGGTRILFTEDDRPKSILFLLEGKVKLSINSIDGRRLIVGIAGPGEILGLTAAVTGSPYEITAETQFPCKITSLQRPGFLDFLVRYPVAYRNVARQLSLDYKRTCEQLRTLGLTSSAPAKLARLLLEWCAEGQRTERGTRIQCSLTHEEIGEYIGVSRETITRTLHDFRNRELVEQRGSTLVVPNLRALEVYAAA